VKREDSREPLGEIPTEVIVAFEQLVDDLPATARGPEVVVELLRRHPAYGAYAEQLHDYVRQARQLSAVGPAAYEGARRREQAPYPPLPAGSIYPPETRLGAFVIKRPLGQGGMGIVYEAIQVVPNRADVSNPVPRNRTVAIKIPLDNTGEPGNTRFERFFREATNWASVHNAHIVEVLTVGSFIDPLGQKCPYLVLEYLDGGSLQEELRDGLPGAQRVAEILRQVADGVGYAHSLGVLHRDLKPANVFRTKAGTYKVGDFGLSAKIGEPPHTDPGTVAGTRGYMAHEVLSGQPATMASDVYSLGVILYWLLTAALPPDAADPSARAVSPQVDEKLDCICRKCLQRDPSRRYDSATSLARDLDHYLRGQPLEARPPTLGEFLHRWYQVHRWQANTALTAFALLVVLALGFPFVTWLYREKAQQEARAGHEARRAKANYDRAMETIDRTLRTLAGKRLGQMPQMEDTRPADPPGDIALARATGQ